MPQRFGRVLVPPRHVRGHVGTPRCANARKIVCVQSVEEVLLSYIPTW